MKQGIRLGIAVFIALAAIILAVLFLSNSPLYSLERLLMGPLSSPLALGNLLSDTALLCFTALGAALALQAGMFNLGGEGQALAGGITVAAVAAYLPPMSPIITVVFVLLLSFSVGALLGGISGGLKAFLNVDEMISSFLISTALLPLGAVTLTTWLNDPESSLIATRDFPSPFHLPQWLPPSRFGPSFLIALGFILLASLFIFRSWKGYEWRIHGLNPNFARYGGIHTGRISVNSMAISGALHATAGAWAVLERQQAIQGFSSGLGWDGLAVALLVSSRPQWIPIASLAYAYLHHGTESALISGGVSSSLSTFLPALVFLLVTIRYSKGRKNGR
ncbi:MAG: ABC transporter permease [Spirochaetales bacterium]|nr:ABC transporter permease [Spirochaetales bacterium]